MPERIVHLPSPTLAATDMDVDKAPGDEETDDAATFRAGKSVRPKLILSIELSVKEICPRGNNKVIIYFLIS